MPVGMYNMAVYCIVIAIHRAVIVIPTQTWAHNSWGARLFCHQLNIIQGTAGQKEYTWMTQVKLIVIMIDSTKAFLVIRLEAIIRPFSVTNK